MGEKTFLTLCCTKKCRNARKQKLLHNHKNDNFKTTFLWYIWFGNIIFWKFFIGTINKYPLKSFNLMLEPFRAVFQFCIILISYRILFVKTALLRKVSILGTTCDIKSPFCQSNENLFSYNNEMWDDFLVWSHIFVYFNFYFALIVVKHPVCMLPLSERL